jgi:hypothetical protein
MAYFQDINVFYDLLSDLFDRLMADEGIHGKARDSELTVKFVYHDPEGTFWIDCKQDPVTVYAGVPPMELTPDAVMEMELDTAHLFWCGKLNLLGALSSGLIQAEGSVPRMLKMLPVIRPSYAIYLGLLQERGLEALIIEDEED